MTDFFVKQLISSASHFAVLQNGIFSYNRLDFISILNQCKNDFELNVFILTTNISGDVEHATSIVLFA